MDGVHPVETKTTQQTSNHAFLSSWLEQVGDWNWCAKVSSAPVSFLVACSLLRFPLQGPAGKLNVPHHLINRRIITSDDTQCRL